MSGNLGLALGGGGAWSIAGLGVIKVLEKEGIKISYLSGCSMGALVAAAYASSFAAEETLEKVEEMLSGIRLRHVFHLNRHHQYGLFSPEKIGHIFEKKVGKFNFEDLKIPLSIVATDFKTGEAVSFTKGPLTPALVSSAAFPIVFSPYPYQGRLLIDGGMSMPTPTPLLQTMGATISIGVDVTCKKHLTRLDQKKRWHHKLIESIPPLHLVLSRHPRKSMGQLVDLLFTNLNRAQIDRFPPTFLLTPEVTHLDQFSFKHAAEFIKAGEESVYKILPDLKKILR